MSRRRDDDEEDFYEDEVDSWDRGAFRFETRNDWMNYKSQVAGKRESVQAWLWFFATIICTIIAFTMFPFFIIGTFACGLMWIITGIQGIIKRWYWRR